MSVVLLWTRGRVVAVCPTLEVAQRRASQATSDPRFYNEVFIFDERLVK
jgi:hypothetical protein